MTNTNPAKKAQLSIIVVGRGGKMRICRMRPDIPSAKASNSMLDVPAGLTLRQAVMQAVADEITKASEAFAKRGVPVNMEIFTIGQVAIKYYQMVPFLKGGNYMTTEDIEAISSERDNAEDKGSYADLAGAIAKAIAQGNGVHLQASGNAALLELIVPEGVTVYDGQLIDFENGASADGVQVRGWRNCSRKQAKVIVRGTKNPRAYITKAEDPAKPWKGLETLLKTIDGCWNALPATNVDKANDDGTEEELYGA